MTIAIGVLCSSGDNILLAADKMISHSNVSSNPEGGKLYESQNGIYLAIADDVSSAHIAASHFLHNVDQLQPSDDKFLDNVKQELSITLDYVFAWKRREILNTVNLTLDEYLHDSNLDAEIRARANRELSAAKVDGLPIEMIVCGFGLQHRIFLYTDGRTILEHSSPGIFYAGSGSDAARDWLNYRGQNVHNSWEKSYYHLLEALHFAQLSRGVGEANSVLLLGPKGMMQALHKSPKSGNDKLMTKLFRKHWSKDTKEAFTDDIRKSICEANMVAFRPSAFQKSKPEP